MFENYPDVMTVKQVAKALGFSTAVVYNLIDQGKIRFFRVLSSYRITKRAVIEFIECGETIDNDIAG